MIPRRAWSLPDPLASSLPPVVDAESATSAAYLATAAEPTDGIVGWVTRVMETLGGPGAGLAIALENLFPPLPSEVILPLAGFTASRGDMSLVGAILWTTLGSVAGALVLYALGALLGRERTRAIAAKLPLVKVSDLDTAEEWFARHGMKTVFLGRMVPIFRSLISIPAGIERMSMPTFLVFTALGSLIWNASLVLTGYLLGESWHVVESYVSTFSKAVAVLVVLAILAFVGSRLVRSRVSRGRDHSDSG